MMSERINQSGKLNGKQIFLTEDDPDLQSQVHAILEKQGATVVSVGSYIEAKNVLENSGPFDVGIIDIRLPKTPEDGKKVQNLLDEWVTLRREASNCAETSQSFDGIVHRMDTIQSDISNLVAPRAGLDLIKDIRRQGNSLPVLFLTGRQNEGTVREVEELKPARLLVKPQRAAKILDEIVALLTPKSAV